MKYNLVVCGGTFDHFHKGHRDFLRFGLSISKKLLLGLTTDKFVVNKRNNGSIENYKTRKKQIKDFLTQEKTMQRVSIEPIDDIYIPKIWEELPIESIIVSKDTISGAKQINLKRREQKKYPLKLEIAPLVKNTNNEYISSSNIRAGIIDREGKPYLNPLWLKHDLAITASLRKKLKEPFGELVKREQDIKMLKHSCLFTLRTVIPAKAGIQESTSPRSSRGPIKSGMTKMCNMSYLITVGDVTTVTFNKLGFKQHISAIDFHVARKRVFSKIKELGFSGREKIIKVVNPPGYLTAGLFKAVSKLFKRDNKKQKIVFVEGEEDLSVLPLILAAPLGSIIFYGQPNEGIVKVAVSEETKKKAYQIVSKFSLTRGH